MAIEVACKEPAIISGAADEMMFYSRVKPLQDSTALNESTTSPLDITSEQSLTHADASSAAPKSTPNRPRSLLSEALVSCDQAVVPIDSGKKSSHVQSNFENKESFKIRKKYQMKLPKEGNHKLEYFRDGFIRSTNIYTYNNKGQVVLAFDLMEEYSCRAIGTTLCEFTIQSK